MKKHRITFILVLIISCCHVSAQELRIEANTSITVESGTTLDISDGDLVLESDNSGDASIIDNGDITYSGGGEAHVQRYITEGKWHLFSSPVNSAQSSMFLDDYFQFHSEASNDWTDIFSDNYSLNVMQGYDLWSVETGPTTEVFSGVTNSGTLNKSFTQNGLGWNLMGNPYPSSIDWDAVVIPAELNGAIWLFDPTIGSNGDYVYYINGGGVANTTSQYIPSGQGFFVRATGGSGTLTINNNTRVHSAQAFYKDSKNENVLVLKVTGNNITTQTAIRFNEKATQEIDRLYDVYKITSDSPDVPILFTRSGNEKMAINTFSSIEDNEIVPMWFQAGTDGVYSIEASGVETFSSETPVFLEDIETGIIQNLKENPKYTFDYKTGNDKSFLIYFSEPQNKDFNSDINIYSHNNILNVNFSSSNFSNSNFEAQIFVFDITGKKILQTSTSNITNQIPLNVKENIYMVKVISGSITASKKVFIK